MKFQSVLVIFTLLKNHNYEWPICLESSLIWPRWVKIAPTIWALIYLYLDGSSFTIYFFLSNLVLFFGGIFQESIRSTQLKSYSLRIVIKLTLFSKLRFSFFFFFNVLRVVAVFVDSQYWTLCMWQLSLQEPLRQSLYAGRRTPNVPTYFLVLLHRPIWF